MLTVFSDHCNDYCIVSPEGEDKHPALWLCYAGGLGFGGYGGYGGYIRRIRMFEIDTNIARITTWKRLEYGNTKERIHEQIIVDGGKAMSPPVEQKPPPEAAADRPGA